MKRDSVSLLLFFFLGIASLLSFALQIYYSTIRTLTPLEMSLISSVGAAFSLASGWYFSKIYSRGDNSEEVIARIIKILEGCTKIGIDSVETSLKNGTTTLKSLKNIRYGFDFLGIAGTKFMPEIFDEKRDIGRFIARNERYTVRIMLLDPECHHIDKWISDNKKAERVRNDIKKTLGLLSEQIRKGRKIQVRLYSFSPQLDYK